MTTQRGRIKRELRSAKLTTCKVRNEHAKLTSVSKQPPKTNVVYNEKEKIANQMLTEYQFIQL